jgi:hypothetical protein
VARRGGERIKRLLPARASRAWLGVAFVGLAVIVVVLVLGLGPRLSAGQDLIDAAKPALSAERVAGDRAGVDFISRYVDLADPLMTARGGASRELPALIGLIARRSDRSQAQVAAALRREAPHAEALLRALPLAGAAREIPRFTDYLATTLNTTDEGLAAELERQFPKLSQTLTALPSVATGWNDIPGIGGLTRFDGTTAVQTVPQLRTTLSEDLVATVEDTKDEFDDVAGSGGIGYIPTLLLVVGAALLGFGLLQARRALDAPTGRVAAGVLLGTGALILVIVFALQYFPRLDAADSMVSDLDPVFAAERIQGDRAGADMIHQTVLFGDPIATRRGGAAAEVPELLSFVRGRTNIPRAEVLAALRRRAPRTTALLQAIPLSAVAAEIPHLLTYLGKTMKLSRAELLATLKQRTPRLAQSLLNVRPVAIRWNSIPGTEDFTRFDGVTPVRTMPALDGYLSGDVVPLLESRRQNFRDLADPSPPLNAFPPILLVLGVLLLIYGVAMTMAALSRRW